MAERIAWTKRLQQVAKWTLIGAVGLFALYTVFTAIFTLVVLVGAELGLWELSLG
jgi:hypothetical protein